MIFDRFNFTTDFRGRWIIKNYDVLPTNEERQFIEKWISDSVNSKRYELVRPVKDFEPKFYFKYFNSILKITQRKLKRKNSYDHYSPKTYYHHYLKPIINKYRIKNLYRKCDFSKMKYIYFPLNFVYDSSLTCMAESFVDQFYLIELVHRYLPFGYKLVVKEHPVAVGTASFNKMKFISKLKDVIILPVYTNSYDIIQNSAGIVVVTSSVGMEALFMGKPVLTFGETYYTGQEATIDVRDLNQLPEKIMELINFKPEREKIIKMFTRIYRESYPISQRTLSRSDYENKTFEVYKNAGKDMASAIIDFCENKLKNTDRNN